MYSGVFPISVRRAYVDEMRVCYLGHNRCISMLFLKCMHVGEDGFLLSQVLTKDT